MKLAMETNLLNSEGSVRNRLIHVLKKENNMNQ